MKGEERRRKGKKEDEMIMEKMTVKSKGRMRRGRGIGKEEKRWGKEKSEIE